MKTEKTKRLKNTLRSVLTKPLTLIWAIGIAALVAGSLIPQAGFAEAETTLGRDKLVRVLIFALLTFYPTAFFPSFKRGLVMATSLAPLGFLLEIVQKYVPGRHFSPMDMIANNMGAIIGILLAVVIRFFFYTGGKNRIGGTR